MRQEQNRKTAVRSRGLVGATTTKDGCESDGCSVCGLPGCEALAAETYRWRG